MNKRTLYWVRRILFVVIFGFIGFAFYQTMDEKKPTPGDPAPNFTLTTLDGKERQLSDLRGKVVVLNFWGTWCSPCREEMPVMEKMYEEYKEKGLEIVAVNIGETDVAVSSFAKQYGLTFPIWMDREREVTRLYGVGPIPSTFFIDSKGVIRQTVQGALQQGQLELHIHSILPGK